MERLWTASTPAAKPNTGLSRPTEAPVAVPGGFALVVATGIVSVSAHLHHLDKIAYGLFWPNLFAYVLLWVLTLIRSARSPAQFVGELTHHSRGASFLAMTAGTCVLGSQFALLTPWMFIARALWLLGAILWLVLSYTFLAGITVREPKPTLEAGIRGAWLLVAVATESISVLGALVATSVSSASVVFFLSLTAYLAGAMLYVFLATLILYRWMFFTIRPNQMTPDYWINMGALAITTLAGALLLQASSKWKLLESLASFLLGSTILFWAAATWWIPLLLIVELWRHLYGHVRLNYSPDYWSLVFPLGMYSAATFMLAKLPDLAFLTGVAQVSFYSALLAWVITFTGLIHSETRRLTRASRGW